MNQGELVLTTKQKSYIGAIGGLCLVLLKLIEQKFFVGSASTNIAIAAYLTYVSYILLGMIVAAFLTDHELPHEKCKRNALLMGLLAPSILIAIVSKPVEHEGLKGNILKDLPTIGSFFINEAYAQDNETVPKGSQKDYLVLSISKKDVDVSFSQAILSTVNRASAEPKYTYLVGVSYSEDKAVEFAEKLNSIINCDAHPRDCVIVISPKGSVKKFVSVGGLLESEESAKKARIETWEAMINKLQTSNDQATADMANVVAKGEVVQGYALFEK